MRILIVDDDADTRLLLSRILAGKGYDVVTAADGLEALAVLEKERIQLVISDWLMPKMDGLELCKRIRASSFPGYVYVIILTAKDSKGELIAAMEAGADDYIAKPFDRNELAVRIRAGERVLNLERDLEDRNESLAKALSIIRKDLEAAARMQKDLLPRPGRTPSGLAFDWIFLPCSFVAGDTFNYMELDGDHVCFFLLDVSGHGVQAAMLSFTLTKTIGSLVTPGNLVSDRWDAGRPSNLFSPVETVRDLNVRFQADEETMQYFTMIYGVMNTGSGRIRLVQAGQPPPIHMRRGREPVLVGTGGFPVGLDERATYEEVEAHLQPGERIILYSDGITDCTNGDGKEFSTDRLMGLLKKWQDLPLRGLMERVEESLRRWRGSDELEDDISLLAIERGAP
jgi:sigma-B regulation protein RsbU (phosphoserine phosphatase)